jgi:hypothetical protein
MSIATILIILLALALVGALPGTWPHSRNWGWGPSGGAGLLIIILLLLLFAGEL